MMNFLTIGVILGISAGFAPGPLLTLVISETLQHGIKSGVTVALAPIVTDLPIILLTLFILAKLTDFHNILGIVSLSGGFFILFMGYECIRIKGIDLNLHAQKPKSLAKGVVANALNPHPYLFWFSVGAPLMIKAMTLNVLAPLAFIFGFYTALVGSKIMLAILIGKSKAFLRGNLYMNTMRFLGMILVVLALALFRDGLIQLGLI